MKLCAAIAVLHHAERVAGAGGVMNNKTAFCTLACGFFKLICPTTVVGHGFAFEQDRILGSKAGVIDHYEHHLIFYIETCIIVPIIFGGYYAEAGENEPGIIY